MTFKEARLNKIEKDIIFFENNCKQKDRERLASIVTNEVCRKILCDDCVLCNGNRCRGVVEDIAMCYTKEVIDWAGIKIPKKLRYLLDEKRGSEGE